MTANGASNSKICVLDDDPSFVHATGQLLSSVGLPTEQFTDPHVFLDYARMHQPRLAIIDISMPVMNGLEFVQAVRADHRYDQLPLMMVTTETEMSQVARALEAGVNEYVMKPTTKDVILEKLQLLGITVP